MLRSSALAAFATVCALIGAGSASAGVTLRMTNTTGDEPAQVLPLTLDTASVRSVHALPPGRRILAPDGSIWSAGDAPTRSMYHDETSLPGLPSGMVARRFAFGSDGRLWFTEDLAPDYGAGPRVDRIGRVDPVTDAITEFVLTTGANAGSIVAGGDGNIWFVEYGTRSIGRVTPAGVVTEFPLPPGVVPFNWRGEEMTMGPGGDLYFLVDGGIGRMRMDGTFVGVTNGGLANFSANAVAYGRDGNLWVTECDGAIDLNTLTRISALSGKGTRMPEGTFPADACPMGLVADRYGTLWLYEWNTGRYGRALLDDPLARTDDPSGVGWERTDLNGSATPRGAATTVHFEYGTSTAYGTTTPEQMVGDDDGAVDVAASVTGLQPLTTYHYRLVATSAIGVVRGTDMTVMTGPKPPPPPPPPPVDRDGDGFFATVDCDDLSAAIHPGAADRPGDRIDQDCNGGDAPYARFTPHPNAGWKLVKGRVVFTRLTVDALPTGAALKLTCSGRGCPRQGYTATFARPTKRVDFAARLKRAQLRKGARVELTLSRPGYVTTIVRWTIGPPPRVTTLCRPPGATKAKAC